jgi:hypothetical protein
MVAPDVVPQEHVSPHLVWDGMKDRRAPNAITARAIEEAVAAGIRAAVANPDTWEAAGKAMRLQAQQATGGWLLGSMKAALRHVGWVVVIFVLVYNLGGLPALLALVKGQGVGAP